MSEREESSETGVVQSMVQAIATALMLGLVGAGFLFTLAVSRWLPPSFPVLMGVVGLVPLTMGAVAIMFEEVRESWPKGKAFWSVAAGVLAIGVLLPGSWAVAGLRGQFLAGAPSLTLPAALEDPSPDIRLKVCARLLDDKEYTTERIAELLSPDPALVRACTKTYSKHPRMEDLSRYIAKQWHEELVAGFSDTKDTAQMCAVAGTFQDLQLTSSQRATVLLDCALQSASADVQECCAAEERALIGTCGELSARVSKSLIVGWNSVADLFVATFDIKTRIKRRKVPESLDLQCAPMKERSLGLLCDVINSGDYSERDIYLFEALLGRHNTCLDKREANRWMVDAYDVCQRVAERLEAGKRISSRNLCEIQKDLATAQVEQQEEFRERAAEYAQNLDISAEDIDRGYAASSSGRDVADRLRMMGMNEDCYTDRQRMDTVRQLWGQLPKSDNGGLMPVSEQLAEVKEQNALNMMNGKVSAGVAQQREALDDEERAELEQFEDAEEERDELEEQIAETEEALGEETEHKQAMNIFTCIQEGKRPEECGVEGLERSSPQGYQAPCIPGMTGGRGLPEQDALMRQHQESMRRGMPQNMPPM